MDLRQAWPDEARVFTPWLAENLDLLAEALGIHLELEDKEVPVGGYKADIVARVPEDDTRVVIENQLEEADLKHLGQILAYLTGLEARTVIWVAKDFRDAHLTAIRWLNENTSEEFGFFAAQVKLIQIDESAPAPLFDVLERPNQWAREVHQQDSLSDHGSFRRRFWSFFVARHPDAPGLKPGHAGANVWNLVPGPDLTVTQFISRERVGVFVIGKWGEGPESYISRLEPFADAVREEFPDEAVADADSGCRTQLSVNTRDENNWEDMADWLHERHRIYTRVLSRGPVNS